MEYRTRQIELLRKACVAAATAATACHPKSYKSGISPLTGHCAAVAYMVQASFGGDIVTGRITNRVKNHYWNKVTHYWNRLPDGVEVDLTSCQFGGDGFTPFKKGRKVKRGELVPIRFLLFAAKVYEIIKGEVAT